MFPEALDNDSFMLDDDSSNSSELENLDDSFNPESFDDEEEEDDEDLFDNDTNPWEYDDIDDF